MDYEPPSRRLRILSIIIAALIGVLVVRLWQVQVLQGAWYLQQSEENRVRDYTIPAPRGIVYDRKGRPLVSNRPSFTVAVLPLELRRQDEVLANLSAILDLSVEEIQSRIAANRDRPFAPVRVRRDVGPRIVTMIEENRLDLPGVIILAEPVRHYLYGPLGAHVLGYVSEIDEAGLAARPEQKYKPGDLIGKAGIERAYEPILRGIDGRLRMEVDAVGRPLREISRVPAIPGRSIVLSLDLDLQRAAAEGLRASDQKSGAVVAMDPRTGGILAMESMPSYDPNLFATGISPAAWRRLTTDRLRPMLNRSISAAFEPGSVFKIVTASAALEEGIVSRTSTFYAPGYFRLGSWTFRDLKAWGTVNFMQGIQFSINVVFYNLGYRLGGERLAAQAKRMGLGALTGIELSGEVAGTIPSPSTKQDLVGEPWYPGDSVNMSIGQGAVTVTPLQVARMMASVANGGTLLKPHLLLGIIERDRSKTSVAPVVQREGIYRTQTLAVLREGLQAAAERGTGRASAVKGLSIAGKTGSAENPRGKPHAWFAGYAPTDAPRLVVVAFVEHGFRGGLSAAPIVGRVFMAAFPPPPQAAPPETPP